MMNVLLRARVSNARVIRHRNEHFDGGFRRDLRDEFHKLSARKQTKSRVSKYFTTRAKFSIYECFMDVEFTRRGLSFLVYFAFSLRFHRRTLFRGDVVSTQRRKIAARFLHS